MTALVHVLRLDGDDTVALCGAPWPPLTAEPDAPVCGACFRGVMAVVDEVEQLRAVIEKVRSHSRPVRYVVEWAEGKRDDAGRPIAGCHA